jgi:hypothetical protein
MKSILVRDFADSHLSFVSVLLGARLTDLDTRINCMSPDGKSRAATTLPGWNWITKTRCRPYLAQTDFPRRIRYIYHPSRRGLSVEDLHRRNPHKTSQSDPHHRNKN